MTLRTLRGATVAIGAEIARGGEGAVHAVLGDPASVAKLYHHDRRASGEAKVCAMVRAGTRVANVTWPTDALYDGTTFVGFLMPNLPAGSTSIYSVITQRREMVFPGKDWSFLIRVAENLSRLFANIHHNGIVIGDVNFGNVFVSGDGSGVTWSIDTDSYHLTLEGVLYPTRVQHPSYTAPEVHDQTVPIDRRSASQDVWALGVLVFQLLFMGAHPSAGIGTPDEEVESIKARCFPYAAGSIGSPPPRSPRLDGVGGALAALFERTFLAREPGARPTAAEYVGALAALGGSLRTCGRNPRHVYVNAAPSCTWCALPVDFFPVVPVPGPVGGSPPVVPEPPFDVAKAWQAILGIRGPVAPSEASDVVPPEPREHRVVYGETYETAGGLLGAFVVGGGAIFATGDVGGALCAALGMGLVGALIGAQFPRQPPPDPHAHRREPWRQLKAALIALQAVCADVAKAHAEAVRKLERDHGVLQSSDVRLRTREAEVIAALQARAREQALRRVFLESGAVSGIGESRLRFLQSFQIETAWDVLAAAGAGAGASAATPDCPTCGRSMVSRSGSRGSFWGCPRFPRCRGTRAIAAIATNRLEEVPSIGPVLAAKLIGWARSVDAVLRPNVTPAAVAAATASVAAQVAQDVRAARVRLEAGPSVLRDTVVRGQRRIDDAAAAYRGARHAYRGLT
jgi:DNA-binding helix-hairpin-helix protein with protein kinase domain